MTITTVISDIEDNPSEKTLTVPDGSSMKLTLFDGPGSDVIKLLDFSDGVGQVPIKDGKKIELSENNNYVGIAGPFTLKVIRSHGSGKVIMEHDGTVNVN